ncbi:MAG: hypothetical protein M3511_00910 [Deinococcota bacterium]|nr:hypothetical protein [Deinococcota bacterium]
MRLEVPVEVCGDLLLEFLEYRFEERARSSLIYDRGTWVNVVSARERH